MVTPALSCSAQLRRLRRLRRCFLVHEGEKGRRRAAGSIPVKCTPLPAPVLRRTSAGKSPAVGQLGVHGLELAVQAHLGAFCLLLHLLRICTLFAPASHFANNRQRTGGDRSLGAGIRHTELFQLICSESPILSPCSSAARTDHDILHLRRLSNHSPPHATVNTEIRRGRRTRRSGIEALRMWIKWMSWGSLLCRMWVCHHKTHGWWMPSCMTGGGSLRRNSAPRQEGSRAGMQGQVERLRVHHCSL